MKTNLIKVLFLLLLCILYGCSTVRTSKNTKQAGYTKSDAASYQVAKQQDADIALPAASANKRVGASWAGHTEIGEAAYYTDKHQNKKTASGEVYKHDLKTAAHKTLPLGSEVKVKNLKNGKSVIVKINDRGPFTRGRIIDLSKSAFNTISHRSAGIAKVEIEVIR